jgi:hypothetical protein
MEHTRSTSITKTLALLALGGALAQAQQYVAVDLTPSVNTGSMAYAVSGGAAAGSIMALGSLGAYVQHGATFAGGAVTDLHPKSWYMTTITAFHGSQLVGLGLPSASSDASTGTHAILWNGSIAVDLNPNGYSGSAGYCTNGFQQGGSAIVKASGGGKVKTTPPNHAALWSGSASSFSDLNPPNTAESRIYACDGVQQAGYVMPVSPGFTHAAVWAGTPSSVVDLHPQNGFVSSIAFGDAAGQQVGYGVAVPAAGGAGHALLWTGSSTSVIDIHPAGYTLSVAYATNGVQQVGEADDAAFPRHKHAVVWSGSAAAIDLNQFLPAGFTDAQAMAIDAAGNIAGYANGHAFLWVPVR